MKTEKKAKAAADADEAEDVAAVERKRAKKEKKAAARAAAEAEAEAEAEAAAAAERQRKKEKKEKKAAARAAAEADVAEVEPPPKRPKSGHVPEGGRNKVVDTQTAPKSGHVPEGGRNKVVVAETAPAEGFRVFVGGLPSHVDEAKIKVDFGECGEIRDILLSRWPEDGSSKGMAFITFATESALNKCLEWNKQIYERKPLRIERKAGLDKDPKKGRGSAKPGEPVPKPDGCLAVAVLDMSTEATDDDLWKFFAECGTISAVRILMHRETGESRGIGFVTFEDTAATDKAIHLSGNTLAGKTMRVEYSAPKADSAGKGKGKGPQEKPEGCMSVVVNNLSTNATEEDIWKLVRDCTSTNNVTIVMDKDTWLSKGMAFVDFDDTDDTDIAVKLSGKPLYGQPISIRYKVPKLW